MTPLCATTRLQLHAGFDLRAAAAQVPYYAALGISHYYLSPIGTARAGSMHGYDQVDPTRVNPELGGEEALRELIAALHRHEMGAIVDIVPNHMAADPANPWWRDVLAHGQQSRYARFFDIDWAAPECEGRLWLPILAASLAQTIGSGSIQLTLGGGDGLPGLACAGRVLPLSTASLQQLAQVLGIDATHADAWSACVDRLDVPNPLLAALIDQQHYRLAHWRSGNDVVNYRRFFDIAELVALSVERVEVFDAVHALPLRLIREGLVDGLRIDHADGLSNPRGYLRRLRRAMDQAADGRPVTLHVEKILAADEALRRDWPVDGSTGYDFMDQAGALTHDADGAAALQEAWHEVSGRPQEFEREELLARQELLPTSLQAEFAGCARAWHALFRQQPATRDVTGHALAQALAEVLLQLRVYRSYLDPCGGSEADRAALDHAFAQAAEHGNPDRTQVRDLLHGYLLKPLTDATPGAQRAALRLAHRRFEQLSAPLNAKAVEDTGFYRFGVLLSRNEVGSDPAILAIPAAQFHRLMAACAQAWPQALLALATHDTKRGPDARARLSVFSERAVDWTERARRWVDTLREDHPQPSGGDIWIMLQSLLGAWPLGLTLADSKGMQGFAERMATWQTKALREAKLATRWTAPDEAYEAACQALLHELLLGPGLSAARTELAAEARALDTPGALNSLVLTTLQLTAPGVPDIYQGSDRWDQSLVDPDNRRPVDYASRHAQLDVESRDPVAPAQLLAHFRDGRIKQWLTQRLLLLRRARPALFIGADYVPLAARGQHADRVLGFLRRSSDGGACLVVVPLHCSDWMSRADQLRIDPVLWGDTALELPAELAATGISQLDDVASTSADGALALSSLLQALPVGIWLFEPQAPR